MSTIINDNATGDQLPIVAPFHRAFFGVELFLNASEHMDCDGFLVMSNVQVVMLHESATGCKFMDAIDPEDASKSQRFDIAMITTFSFSKIKSKKGRHIMSRLVFELPLDLEAENSLRGTCTTSKFTMKFSRNDYSHFRKSYYDLLAL